MACFPNIIENGNSYNVWFYCKQFRPIKTSEEMHESVISYFQFSQYIKTKVFNIAIALCHPPSPSILAFLPSGCQQYFSCSVLLYVLIKHPYQANSLQGWVGNYRQNCSFICYCPGVLCTKCDLVLAYYTLRDEAHYWFLVN